MGMRPTSDAPCTLFCPRRGCKPVPSRPMWPQIRHKAIKARQLSVPWVCWERPIPQKIMLRSAVAYPLASSRSVSAEAPVSLATFSGV